MKLEDLSNGDILFLYFLFSLIIAVLILVFYPEIIGKVEVTYIPIENNFSLNYSNFYKP
jgi:hypothetical protein